ncbi:hypothetical protein [Pseudomonas sp. ACN5]|uniref:hypothetical protein n=1 Tax=Pseudomonas sp. ACN5 TaxID=1920427 RepID=UPI001144A4BE|nr:hypothetical protein [Pseudomonas sp. ACN5]PBJ03231.1 hypothetical protein BSF40_44440 [Pseudomonas sp. ACN5]
MKNAITKAAIILYTCFLFALSFSAIGGDKPPIPTVQKIPCGIAEVVVKQIYTRAYDITKFAAVDSIVPMLETSISSMKYIRESSDSCSKVDNFLSFLESALSKALVSQKEEARAGGIAGFTSRSSVTLDKELQKNSGGGSFSGEIRPRVNERLFDDRGLGGGTRIEQVIRSE